MAFEVTVHSPSFRLEIGRLIGADGIHFRFHARPSGITAEKTRKMRLRIVEFYIVLCVDPCVNDHVRRPECDIVGMINVPNAGVSEAYNRRARTRGR